MGVGRRIFYVLRQMFRRYFSDGVSQSAAELAYFLLFSFAPLLMFLNSVLAQMNISADSLQIVVRVLPKSVQELILGYFSYIGNHPSISPMIIGIALTLYFMSRAMSSLVRTANKLYRVEVRRSGIYQRLLSVLMTAGFLLAIVGSFVLVVISKTVVRLAERWVTVPQFLRDFVQGGNYWLVIGFVFFLLLLFNRFVPNMPLRWSDALPGAAFSTVFWILASVGFSFYVDNMARYSLLYGSLGALIVLMLWLYLTGQLLIMGTQLNHVIYVARRYDPLVSSDMHPSK